MRVIGGEYRSRPLKSVPGLDVRPTPDRLREALFNILAPSIQGVVFADVYAGTGAVGIEALSRGARQAVFIESARAPVTAIRANLKALGLEHRALVLQARALTALPGVQADLFFVDPPYRLANQYDAVLQHLGSRGAATIVQHDIRQKLQESYAKLSRVRVLTQGDNCLSFYESRSDENQ